MLLEVGRVARAQGLRGECMVDLLSDRPERLAPGSVLETDRGPLTVVEAHPHQHRWRVRFEGFASREDVEPLVEAYVAALPPGLATTDDVGTGARVMAVYTALTRLDWALARVADGDGALAGKFRHPSVAPYIRAMQRQVGQIEALLA